ncbi:MAG TPA: dihydroorotase [Thermoplasmata archaeon]|nr:dihydroorotase [Thermoplasmata archaeon]
MRVIRGRVYYRGRVEPLDLGVDDAGTIVAIRKSLGSRTVEDHGDALILPGCVDMHVHFRDPGLTEKDDFPSGTRSAAIGGVTTVIDMPNTRPPVTTADALRAKWARLRVRAAVDYGLFAAPRDGAGVAALDAATAFKVYMAESTGNLQIAGDNLGAVVRSAGEARRLVVAHAEDAKRFRPGEAATLSGHSQARPKESEVSAIQTLAEIRGEATVHIAHLTCVEALDAVPEGVTTEVTPHHLLLDSSRPLKAFGKVNPPLRSPEDRKTLWDAFAGGRIEVVASDHAPHTRDEKEEPFDEAPAGLPGVATALPLLLRQVRSEALSLERLVDTMATRPAEILGIPKGRIEVGRDADLIVVDARTVTRITARRVRYKCGWTPFEGMEGVFPRTVYLRGERIVEDGEPIAEEDGRPVARNEP